jgi:hypothetical protein
MNQVITFFCCRSQSGNGAMMSLRENIGEKPYGPSPIKPWKGKERSGLLDEMARNQ